MQIKELPLSFLHHVIYEPYSARIYDMNPNIIFHPFAWVEIENHPQLSQYMLFMSKGLKGIDVINKTILVPDHGHVYIGGIDDMPYFKYDIHYNDQKKIIIALKYLLKRNT